MYRKRKQLGRKWSEKEFHTLHQLTVAFLTNWELEIYFMWRSPRSNRIYFIGNCEIDYRFVVRGESPATASLSLYVRLCLCVSALKKFDLTYFRCDVTVPTTPRACCELNLEGLHTCLHAGKTYMMLGVDDSPLNLGIIPSAIAWLYRLVDERRQTTGARFSVRVSAVEVTGRHETVKDLLANVTAGRSSRDICSSGFTR